MSAEMCRHQRMFEPQTASRYVEVAFQSLQLEAPHVGESEGTWRVAKSLQPSLTHGALVA